MAEVLYRKYRPKKFEEIVGQDQVKIVLKKAIENQSIAHAYIFFGPRGTGKTTTARILAKALNCLSHEDKPCGKCESCIAVDNNSHMDVIEIDAASYRGIDEIRKIRDAASYRPTMGHYKVYIVDEFHMLTREAFNALLKTLEEPPEHIVFILATTNLEKVPETILSRCQVFTFKPLSEGQIVEYLQRILKEEKKTYTVEALKIIAKAAKGGMRDAVNLLERALVFGEKIEEDNVKNILGILPEEYLKSYLIAILNGDSDEIVALSENIERLGYSHDSVIRQSIELTKDMISRRELEFERGVKLIEKLWEVNREMRYSENKKLTFEVLSLTTLAAMNVPSVSVEPAKAVNAVVKEEVKKSNEEKEVEPITTDIDVSKNSEKVDSKFKEFFETIYEEGHVLIWVLLNLATIKEEDDVFALSFALNDLFARELAKEHIETISELMKMRLGKPAKINDNDIVESSDILKKLNPDEKAYVKRILTLFEGLDAKDVKIEIEEEGNG